MSRVFALLVVGALTACAEVQLEHQSDAINRASAATIGEHVLLNAVRASLDLPMSFTKLQKYTAANMTSGSFSPKFPFGPDALHSRDLGPSVSWSPGPFQIEYVDVNTAGGLTKLNQSIAYSTIHRYTSEGVPLIVASTLFIENFYVHAQLAIALVENAEAKCYPKNRQKRQKTLNRSDQAACNELDRIANEEGCGYWWADVQLARLGKKHPYYVIENHAQEKCDFLKFQSFWMTLRLAGYNAELGNKTETTYEKADPAEKKLVPVKKTETFAEVSFDERKVQRTIEQIERGLKATKLNPLIVNARSPRSTISFLGELIALQNYSSKPYIPKIMRFGGDRVVLFDVVRGAALEPAALSVMGPNGATYYVPQPAYGESTRVQTMRLLAMTSEVINAAISEKDFPAPSSIVVRTIQ